MTEALVIGAGPAGLRAAEALLDAGARVLVAEAKPSVGRKFLMAGKSGLNLTKSASVDEIVAACGADLRPMLEACGAKEVCTWAEGLGQELFTGSTGRVFPRAMKASPLLRAWLGRLQGAEIRTRWRWTGWDGDDFVFDTPDGETRVSPRVSVLALGGASWARLGADGAWAPLLAGQGVPMAPFQPANGGVRVSWSPHMDPHLGTPLKGVAFRAGALASRGECVISNRGLEGGGIYEIFAGVRDGADLSLDLLPDLNLEKVAQRLGKSPKASVSERLRKLGLEPAKRALAQEFGRPVPRDADELARLIKALPVRHAGPRPMDEAISTAGGVAWDGLTEGLELKAKPGVFAAGEMLDWEAPTGGYLLTGCLATGRWAGIHAARHLGFAR